MKDKKYFWRLYYRGRTSKAARTVCCRTKARAERLGYLLYGKPMDADLVRGA